MMQAKIAFKVLIKDWIIQVKYDITMFILYLVLESGDSLPLKFLF